MNSIQKYKLRYLGLAFFIFAVDQLSKWWVTEKAIKAALEIEQSYSFLEWYAMARERLPFAAIEIFPFFNIVMVWNRGVSFGMFTQDSALGSWFLIGVSIIITLWFGVWLFTTQSKIQRAAIALVIGGAVGNALDRFRFNGVIDFLDFHAFGWHYPAFNVADSCIVVGVFILIFYALFLEKSFQS